mgnify:CR=1 FL=1
MSRAAHNLERRTHRRTAGVPRPPQHRADRPSPPSGDRHLLRRVDWGAPSAEAFYRSLEEALDAPAPFPVEIPADGPDA